MLPAADYQSLKPEALITLAQSWEAGSHMVKLLGDVENLVWHAQGSRPFILRMTVPQHRSQAALAAELAWLEILYQDGLPVCQPIPSPKGHLIEPWMFGEQEFFVTCFAWIDGHFLEHPGDWRAEIVRNLGRLTARLHQHGQSLSLVQMAHRPDWRGGEHLQQPERWLTGGSPEEQILRTKFKAIQADICNLPQTSEHFGLIHGDIHRGNFLIKEDQPILFDFDDAHRGWFAQDLALILYYAIPRESTDPQAFANWFQQELQLGYEQICPWPILYSECLDLFLRWRDLQLYLFILCRWPEQRPEKAQAGLNRLLTRILQGQTLLNPC